MSSNIIEATKCSPRIELNATGLLIMQGRSLMEDTFIFYQPIIEWAKNVVCDQLTLEVRMEYMNTSSSKQLLFILKAIATNPSLKNVYVKWFYEEDDEDMLEMGKEYEALLSIPFDFYEYYDEMV